MNRHLYQLIMFKLGQQKHLRADLVRTIEHNQKVQEYECLDEKTPKMI